LYLIRPITITDAMLVSSNVLENDAAEYVGGSAYSVTNQVILTADSKAASVGSNYLESHIGNFIDGNAFFMAIGTDLSQYMGSDQLWAGNRANSWTPYKITLTDAAGKKAVGYISGQGTGTIGQSGGSATTMKLETVGIGSTFLSGSPSWTAGTGWTRMSDNTGRAINGQLLYCDAGLVADQLYYSEMTVVSRSADSVALYYGGSTNTFHFRTAAAAYTEYAMSDGAATVFGFTGIEGATKFDGYVTGPGLTKLYKVMEPKNAANGGLHIVEARNSIVRNWASVEGGFSPWTIASYSIENVDCYHMIYECYAAISAGQYYFPPNYLVGEGAPEKWEEVSATNRWKVFDGIVQDQCSNANTIEIVLTPGSIDSVALFNLDADTVEIYQGDNLVVNGTEWAGATGTTQPTSWDKEGTPSAYLIDGGALKITADASNEGIGQVIAVTAGTAYRLLGRYKSTSGVTAQAQYGVWDIAHGGYIGGALVDLAASTAWAPISYTFTPSAGCNSVDLRLLAKANLDVVWFDSITLSTSLHTETITLAGADRCASVDLHSGYANGVLKLTITKTGSTAKCGEIVTGLRYSLGTTLANPNPSIGIVDYSTKTVDATTGIYTISEQPYADTGDFSLRISRSLVDDAFQTLAGYRATPVVYVGDADEGTTVYYGIFKEVSIGCDHPDFELLRISLMGLT
jgi:hypothetical protein